MYMLQRLLLIIKSGMQVVQGGSVKEVYCWLEENKSTCAPVKSKASFVQIPRQLSDSLLLLPQRQYHSKKKATQQCLRGVLLSSLLCCNGLSSSFCNYTWHLLMFVHKKGPSRVPCNVIGPWLLVWKPFW